jgi:hypothetical protein
VVASFLPFLVVLPLAFLVAFRDNLPFLAPLLGPFHKDNYQKASFHLAADPFLAYLVVASFLPFLAYLVAASFLPFLAYLAAFLVYHP